jgi:hypothetical protein
MEVLAQRQPPPSFGPFGGGRDEFGGGLGPDSADPFDQLKGYAQYPKTSGGERLEKGLTGVAFAAIMVLIGQRFQAIH